MLKVLPEKAARNRRKHIVVRDCSTEQHIEARRQGNSRYPYKPRMRFCRFERCGLRADQGHGTPSSRSYRLCILIPGEPGETLQKQRKVKTTFSNYCVCTDMKETDIVFGGEKKLKKAIDEIVKIFNPEAISISATCPVGLIGDDIEAVGKRS